MPALAGKRWKPFMMGAVRRRCLCTGARLSWERLQRSALSAPAACSAMPCIVAGKAVTPCRAHSTSGSWSASRRPHRPGRSRSSLTNRGPAEGQRHYFSLSVSRTSPYHFHATSTVRQPRRMKPLQTTPCQSCRRWPGAKRQPPVRTARQRSLKYRFRRPSRREPSGTTSRTIPARPRCPARSQIREPNAPFLTAPPMTIFLRRACSPFDATPARACQG